MRRALVRALLVLLTFTCVGPALPGGLAAEPEPHPAPQIVRITVASQADVQILAASRDIWEVRPDEGYIVALVTLEERQALQAQGYDVAVDEALTASLSAVSGYPCYRTMDELYADLERLAVDHADVVQVYTIGYGFEGRPLVVARLTNRAIPGDKPVLFVMGGIHGRELITVEVVTAFAERLAERYGLDPDVTWILDHHEVHLLVSANPDGHARNETSAAYWRKNTHPYGVCTYYGVDLNRNHTYKWNACDGCSSGDPCAWSYRGPAPGSEPETRAIEAYTRALFADRRGPEGGDPAPLTTSGAFLTLHAYGNEVMWPWGWTSAPPPNVDGLAAFARKLSRYNGYSAIPSWQLYFTDGTSDDWAYGTLGVAALTFEIGSSTDGMYPPCRRYDALVQPNLDALLYAARVAQAPYLQSHGPDALALSVALATVRAGAPVTLTALINDSATGGQAIAAAEYAIDVPWWDGGETWPMAAVDGNLDAPVEEVAATIETAGWAPGRHTIWVRGRDAAGNWGPPSAVWVEVEGDAAVAGRVTASESGEPLAGARLRLENGAAAVGASTDEAWEYAAGIVTDLSVAPGMTATADLALDPLALGVLAGRVRGVGSGQPLTATLAVAGTPVSVTATAGDYVLPLPAGAYSVTATAPGHGAGVTTGLAVTALRTTRHDVELAARPPLLVVDDDSAGDWLRHDREAWHVAALDALGLDHAFWPVKEWGPPGADDLAPYAFVLWLTGDARYDTLTLREQGALRDYLEGGGALLLSGQHMARDIAADPGSFLRLMLGADYLGTVPWPGTVVGFGPLEGLTSTLGGGDDANNAYAPAALGAAEKGEVAACYEDGRAAAVAVDAGRYRALLLGFGVESVATAAEREALLRAALAWLGAPVDADGLTLRAEGPPGPVAPGDALQYGLTLTNATAVTRTGVIITGVVPAGVTVASAEPAATLDDGVIRWEVPPLPPGEALVVRFSAHLDGDVAAGSEVAFGAYGAASAEGPAIISRGTVRTLVALARDVSLSAPAALAYGWRGETATVGLGLANRGLTTDTYTLSAVGGPWPATPSAGQVTLAPGQSEAVALAVAVPDGIDEGETAIYTVRATSMADTGVEDRAVVAVTAGIARGRIWIPALSRR